MSRSGSHRQLLPPPPTTATTTTTTRTTPTTTPTTPTTTPISMHVICDEIFALSVFEPAGYTSIFDVIEPGSQDVHVLWGASKVN